MENNISIIVPVYKAEKYLHRCVDSILAQTFTDFELLLINDGSSDNSGKICDEYAQKDNRVRVFHKENGGVSSARNLGLDNTKGDWITFVDSDDWLKPECLERLTNQLDADMIKCGVEASDKSFSWNTKNGKCNVKQFLEKYEKESISRTSCVTLFKAELIHKFNIRFDEKIRFGEDMIFNLLYLSFCQHVRMLDYIGYIYFYETETLHYVKYNLSFNDIEISLQKALDLRIRLKELTGANVDLEHDLYLYFSTVSINKLKDSEYLSSYFDLCKKFVPSLDIECFYNTSYLSPITRGLSELKYMYEKKLYANGEELYKALYCINSNCNVKISFPYKDFYIWNWLIKHKLFYILDFSLKFYFLLKTNIKNKTCL